MKSDFPSMKSDFSMASILLEEKQKEKSKNADKSLDTSDLQKIKTKSIRTQYNTKHFSSSSCQEDEISKT